MYRFTDDSPEIQRKPSRSQSSQAAKAEPLDFRHREQ
jgi:hypothetical protein